MKPYSINIVRSSFLKVLPAALLIHTTQAEDAPATPKMRDAATHQQLVTQFRIVEKQDPMRTLKPAKKKEDPSKVNQPESLLGTSDIICFGGVAVLVPKRAILQLPTRMADRLILVPGSDFVSWADFYAANRGWITTVEVSRVQAEGNLALEKQTKDRMSKSANMIVATFMGGPISVLPLKVPVEKTAELPKP